MNGKRRESRGKLFFKQYCIFMHNRWRSRNSSIRVSRVFLSLHASIDVENRIHAGRVCFYEPAFVKARGESNFIFLFLLVSAAIRQKFNVWLLALDCRGVAPAAPQQSNAKS